MRVAKTVLVALLASFAALGLLIVWMAEGIQSPRRFEEQPIVLADVAAEPPRITTTSSASTITVLTWNIAWGYGWGSEGTGPPKPRSHFEFAQNAIAEVVRNVDADIVLLQEVDFGSTRSHGFEQARAIARAARMPYVATALSWKANWVPFPYWPPTHQFGRIRSGGAILSRYPIVSNQVELMPKPSTNRWVYNLFYLFRYLQAADIQVGDRKVRVVNTHFEAFDEPNRIAHAERARARLLELMTPDLIFGGDLNAVPPESKLKSNYPDEDAVRTNHENDRTVGVIRGIPGLRDLIPPETFAAGPEGFFTFPSQAPNRKLDYIFAGEGLEPIEARGVAEAGQVSDHLPLLVRLRFRPPAR